MAIRIITDSTSDFTRAEAAQLGLEIVPLKTRFGDEEYIDGVTISPKEFYEKLIEGDVLPTTSQPSPSEFEEVYDRVLGPEDEAVVITHLRGALRHLPERAHRGGKVRGPRIRGGQPQRLHRHADPGPPGIGAYARGAERAGAGASAHAGARKGLCHRPAGHP